MIAKINEIVDWYVGLPSGYSNVTELINARQRLSGYLFNYTVLVGDLRKQYNSSQAIYEGDIVKWEMKSSASSSTKAKLEAKANCSKLFTILKDAEGDYFSHKENCEAIKEVLNSMSQSIAFARKEWEIKSFQNS